MASQYDSIKDPKELVAQVAMHGMSTKQEDICRIQDIFGRAPVEDLVALANDKVGRGGTQQTFYMVLFNIWHWEVATRFYNQHTNPEFKKLKESVAELEAELTEARTEAEENKEDCEVWMSKHRAAEAAHAETVRELEFYQGGYEAAHLEITKLKAKLYDMMMAQEGK